MNLHSQKFRRPLRLILSIFQLAIDILICVVCLKFFHVEKTGLLVFVAGSVVVFFKFSALYGFKYIIFRYGRRACLRSVFYAWIVSMLFAYFTECSSMGSISAGLVVFLPAVLAARYIFRHAVSAIGIVPPQITEESLTEIYTGSANASPFTLRRLKSFLDKDKASSREQVMERIKNFRKRIEEHKNS